MHYCHVNLIGRIGKFLPEPRENGGNIFSYKDKNGEVKKALSFTVYVNDKKGNKLEDTRLSVTVYGWLAEHGLEILETGCLVHIMGTLSTNEYGPQDNRKLAAGITIGNSFGSLERLKDLNKPDISDVA